MRAVTSLAVVALLVAVSQAAKITEITPTAGSVLGGTRLTILGEGFDLRGRSNLVYIGTSKQGVTCDPVPNECHDKRIVCITDPSTMRGKQPLSVSSFNFPASCNHNSGCTFTYTYDRTPMVDAMWPQWVADPADVTVSGYRFSQGDPTVANFDFTMHLGEEERCNIDTRPISWSSYQCGVESMPFAGVQDVQLQMGAYGNAVINDGADQLAIHPTIQGVEPANGSTAGGQRITIYGSSTSKDPTEIKVRVHGTPCEVVEAHVDYVVCVTTEHKATTPATRSWMSGKVFGEFWDNIAYADIPRLVGNQRYVQPDESRWMDAFGGENLFGRRHNSAFRLTTHFVPNATGNWTFRFRSDDDGELWLAEDENPVARVKTAVTDFDPTYARRIGATWGHTNSYFSWPEQSRTVELEAGKKYWMQTIVSNGHWTTDAYVRAEFGNATIFSGVIPKEFLSYSAAWMPPVEMWSRGLKARIGNPCLAWGNCDYHFLDAKTPTVASVTPSTVSSVGTALTFAGTGFSANAGVNEVKISGVACVVTSSSATQIVCTAPNIASGVHLADIKIAGKGRAIGSVSVTINAAISGVTFVGARISIAGNGFGTDTDRVAVKLDTTACPIESLTNTLIVCQAPASVTAGTVAANVEIAGTTYAVAPFAFVFDQPFVRPGTSITPGKSRVRPSYASVWGTTVLTIDIPGWRMNKASSLSVTVGTQTCAVVYSFFSRVVCRAPSSMALGKQNVTVTYGSSVKIAGEVTYREVITDVYPLSMSTMDGNRIRLSVETLPHMQSETTITYQGQNCVIVSFQSHFIECIPGTARPSSNPVLGTFSSSSTTVPQSLFATDGVRATANSFIVPEGDFIVTRRVFNSPAVLKARVKPTAANGCVRFGMVADGSSTQTGTHVWGGHRYWVDKDIGTVPHWGVNFDTWNARRKAMGVGSLASTKFEADVWQNWRVEMMPSVTRFYVDDVLVSEYATNRVVKGVVGLIPSCQDVEVQDISVEDLSQRQLQVNMSGVPVHNIARDYPYDAIEDESPVTSVAPVTGAGDDVVSILGSNFRVNNEWTNYASQIVATASATTAYLPGNYFSLCSSMNLVSRAMSTCTISPEVPAGTYQIRYRTWYGFAHTATAFTVNAKINSITPAMIPTAGAVLTIGGAGFTNNNADTTITVGGVACPVISSTPTVITCELAAGSGSSVAVSVTHKTKAVPSCSGCTLKFNDNTNAPNVTIMYGDTYTNAYSGSIRIDGTNLGWGFATIGGQPCQITSASSTRMYCVYRQQGSGVLTGSQPFKIHVHGKGYAIGTGLLTSVTLTQGIWKSWPTTGSNLGGARITVAGVGFALPSSTVADDSNFAAASTTLGWTLSRTAEFTTCSAPMGRMLGGRHQLGYSDWAAKTVSGLPAHTHLSLRVHVALVDDWWHSREALIVTVDGTAHEFSPSRAHCHPKPGGRSLCGRSDYNDCELDMPFVVPHTAATATVNISTVQFYRRADRSFGLQRVTIATASALTTAVTVGGSACPIAYMDPALIACTAPVLTAADHAVAVTVNSNALPCAETCNFNATAGAPTLTVLGFSGMRKVNGLARVDWARTSSLLDATNGAAAGLLKTSGSNSWNAGATSSQSWDHASGFYGVEFEFTAQSNRIMFGLRTHGRDEYHDYQEIDFAVYLSGTTPNVYEHGVHRMDPVDRWVTARVFRILVDRSTGAVSYELDGKTFYVSTGRVQWPVRLEASIHDTMSGVQNVKPLFVSGSTVSAETPVVIAGANIPNAQLAAPSTAVLGGAACTMYHQSMGRVVCLTNTPLWIGASVSATVSTSAGASAATTLTVRPLVAGISHVAGSTNGGHMVSIWGSGFGSDAAVTIGGVACAVTGWDFWTVNCTTGALAAGEHAIALTVNSTAHACASDVYPSTVDVSTTCPIYNVSAAWTPVVSSVSPTTLGANTVATITGTNFIPWTAGSSAPAPKVMIGTDGWCAVTADTTNTTIVCTVMDNVAASATALTVNFATVGSSNGFTVSVPLTVTSAAAQIGNLGGAVIVVTGSGFGATAGNVMLKDASLNALCTSVTVQSSSQFTCVAAAFTLAPAASTDIVLHVGTATLNVGLTSSSAAWLTSAAANVATLTSVSPATAAWGDVIIVTGTNLAGATSATVGSEACIVVSSTATEVRCRVNGSLPMSAQAITVTTAPRGLATGAVSVTGVLKIVEATPKRGMPAGVLTIYASGVTAAAAAAYKVDVGGWSCTVTATTTNSITCTLPTPASFVGKSLDVRVRHLGTVGTVSQSFSFTTPTVPTVTGVSPTLGSAAGGESVTITGTGYDASPSLNTVTIGGKPCIVTSGTTTSLVCTTPALASAAATAAVVVSVNDAVSTEAVTFDAQLAVTALSVSGGAATAISTEGGITLVITGTGFPVSEKKYASIKVGSLDCPITATSTTSMSCTLPPSTRAREARPTLLNAYANKPAGTFNVSVWVNKTVATIDTTTLFVTYSAAATPSVTAVSISGSFAKQGDTVTITGTGLAASGNIVKLGVVGNIGSWSACNVATESATSITCTVNATTFGRHFVRVWVPGKGYASTVRACGAGEFLMCDGTCLKDADCTYAEWGFFGECQNLAHLVNNDTFCHSNGGTDRVNIPLRLDTDKDFNLNCPMYSCEGSDCDTVLEIGGRGGRVSTCRGDPNGFVVEVKPTITGVSAVKTSSVLGGLRVTLTGTNLDMKAVIRIGSVASCVPVSATGTQVICETTAAAESTGHVLALWRDRVQADCGAVCTGFSFAAASTPTVTAAVETRSGRPRCTAGAGLTLVGTGFSSTPADNIVAVKGTQGTVTAANATHITVQCPPMEAGDYVATVRVVGKGLAAMFRNDFRYWPTVTGLSTTQTSLAGGQVVTIAGSGFTSSNVTVTIGSACAMKTLSVNATHVVARTLPCTSTTSTVYVYNADWSRSDCWISPDCRMSANNGLTPIISSVNQAAVITIAGTFLTTQQSDLSVTIGDSACTVNSFSGTELTCTPAASHRAGTYPILVSVAGYGYGYQAAQATKTYAATVTSFTPTSGALGGNQLVSITGTGFGTTTSSMWVGIGGIACAVQSSTATLVICKTGASAAAATSTINVTILSGYDGVNNTVVMSSASYAYDAALTPTITSITPYAGSTAGGTRLTMAGTNLATSQSVTIEGVTCTQDAGQQAATTATSYQCTTGNYTTAEVTKIVLSTASNGDGVVTGTYQYIDLWSRWTTWGNTAPPVAGDSAVVSENQTVVLDVSPPQLFLIIVMGHLKFDPAQDLTLECTYIMVNFGRFTVGTHDTPYTRQATIRLYGDRLTPEIPVHGSKVLAVRHGALDMHGIKRQPTWTTLSATGAVDDTTIQITGPVDWVVGEEIVIASTDYKVEHAEPRKITAISGAATSTVTITLDEPLHYEHYGQRQCFGTGNTHCVDEVAEVILLTRNIVVEGDNNTARYGFGGTMFLMPMGQDQNKYVRMSYVELRDVGQQYIVGRYPVHFHVTHEINNSYVNGTSVHRSLNRAYSIHGTNNNTYVNNVVYDTHGHSFFIEDGSEKYNVIDNNVVIFSRSSTSNLNTDITPANFWVVSPLNKVTNNRACGGHAYGFWIAPFHPHSTGPTFSPNICPSTHKMWEFSKNTAHSNAKYGLNIFRFWWPKKTECDFNGPDEQAYITHHLSFKNKIHGVTIAHSEIGSVGAVKLDNLTSADNGHDHPDGSAFWVEHSEKAENMTFGVQNSLLIALSNNQPYRRRLRRRAINLPLGDNFVAENITFVNYNGENFGYEPQAWAERMSFCFPWGWEAVSSGLTWINSPNRILYRFDHHGVINDLDGTLSGTAHTQILPKTPIFDPAHCVDAPTTFSTLRPSVVCHDQYKVRRFDVSTIDSVWKDQLWTIEGRTELVPEIKHKYSMVAPINKNVSIDFQHAFNPGFWEWKITPRFYQPWERMLFNTWYKEVRHTVNATFNNWEPAVSPTWPMLDANVSQYRWSNGSFQALMVYPKTHLRVTGHSCPAEGCPTPPSAPPPVDKDCEPFDAAATWTNITGTPANNSAVHVTYRDAVCLDRPSGVYHLASLKVEGSVVLLNRHCPASGKVVIYVRHWIHLRGGILQIGNTSEPLTNCSVEIVYGNVNFNNQAPHTLLPWGTRSLTVEAGKFLVYAPVPTKTFVRLASTAAVGATTLTVDAAVHWMAGDEIVVASTQRELMFVKEGRVEQSEKHVIAAVSGTTITLTAPLRYEHIGRPAQNINGKTVAASAEVALLTRRVKIHGNHNGAEPVFGQGWAFNIGCTEGVTKGCGLEGYGSSMSRLKTADVRLNGVSFVDVGQQAVLHSSIEVDGLVSSVDNRTALGSYIRGCSFDRTWNDGIQVHHTTTGFEFSNNILYNVQGDGVRVVSGGNTLDGNVVIAAAMPLMGCGTVYKFVGSPTEVCRPGSFRIGANNTVTNNVAASGLGAGFITDGDECGMGGMWADNQAHAVRDGVLVFDSPADPHFHWPRRTYRCRQVGGVIAHGCADQGLAAWYVMGHLRVSNFTSIDNNIGLSPLLAQLGSKTRNQYEQRFYISDSTFWGSFPGQACRTGYKIPCRKTLLDSNPWCQAFHSQAPFMYNVGLLEAVFVTGEYSKRTKGEHKFMWMEPDSYAAIFGRANVANVHFDHFNGDTTCGTKSVAFYQNPFSNDTFHQHVFEGITWGTNMANGGEFYARKTYGDVVGHQTVGVQSVFLDFDNIKFGAYWPDAPNKVWLVDKDGSFSRSAGLAQVLASETIVRDNIDFQNLPWNGSGLRDLNALPAPRAGCTKNAGWNAYVCSDLRMMSLSVEHLGEDHMTRRAAPVVLCKGNGMIGRDGKPLCQGSVIDFASGPVMKGKIQRATLDRIARWRFIAEIGGNYTLYFRGQPPAWTRLAIKQLDYLGAAPTEGWPGITINLRYFGLNSEARVGVYRDGRRLISSFGRSDPWDATPPVAWPSSTDPSGTHYHNKKVGNGVATNVMSVTLRDGTWVDLKQEPIVLVNMQVSMPMDEFFNQQNTFAAAMANVLGIESSRMKFVDIQPGTTRRRLMASTSAAMEIEMSSTAANAGNGSQVASNDLLAIHGRIQNLGTQIGNFTVSSMSSNFVGVTIPEPPIIVAEGYEYVKFNITIPTGNAFNASLVQESIAAVTLTKFSATPQNATTVDEVAVSNSWTDANNYTRFTVNFAFEEGITESNRATAAILTALQNSENVLPTGYVLQSFVSGQGSGAPATTAPAGTGANGTIGANGTTVAAGSTGAPTTVIPVPTTGGPAAAEPVTITSLSKNMTFVIACVVGLVAVTLMTIGLLYYFIKVRPARFAAKAAAAAPPTASSAGNDPFAGEEDA